MSDHEYPIPVLKVVKTFIEICRYQDRSDLTEILENCNASFVQIDFDNWDGGQYTYRLHLELPIPIFALYGNKIGTIEKELFEHVSSIDKKFDNDFIGEVMISPTTEDSNVYGKKLTPSEAETKHLWKKGFFKLFLSHLSEHKVQVHELKSKLKCFGIDAFVAHDDIDVSSEWQKEIELALRSMDSLVALVTPKFRESSWCDQEVGWARGRGVPIITAKLGIETHGFTGKYQAFTGKLNPPNRLALTIFKTLKSKEQTTRAIYRALPHALTISESFNQSIELVPYIEEYKDYTDFEKKILWNACQRNRQVRDAFGVSDTIYNSIGKPPSKPKDEDVPF